MPASRLKLLFVVEGYTDIRFVAGLSEIADLTLAVPQVQYRESGLGRRIEQAGIKVQVAELPGRRFAYQQRCFRYLWNHIREFDVVLSQEMLRGSFNACMVGALKGAPVVLYTCLPAIDYFRCRRERKQLGWVKALAGEWLIRALMTINGRLAARCVAMGPYLCQIARRYCPRTENGLYYGVDTDFFRPADTEERRQLRRKLDLPVDKFLIFLSSRISHEKDPETVLRAASIARKRGLDAVVLNLGGGYKDFLELGRRLELPGVEEWILGRPAAHPMTEVADYFRTADVMALASLSEGLGISNLEALACGTPVVCTAVGGMALELKGLARLTPRRDAEAMAREFLWIAANTEAARAHALQGREYVVREWNRRRAFSDLLITLQQVARSKVAPESRPSAAALS